MPGIQFLRPCLVVLAILLFAGSVSAQVFTSPCGAAMGRVAHHYSRCLLLADVRYARDANMANLEHRRARCQNRFDRRVSREISRYRADECDSRDLVSALKGQSTTFAEGAATMSLRGQRHLRGMNRLPSVCADLAPPTWACVGCEYPEKNFIHYDIPARVKLGNLYLDALKPADLNDDFAAIFEGPETYLKGLFGKEWPEGLTEGVDLSGLCWHYNSFFQKRSFAWVIRDEDRNYLGCAYYFPKMKDKGASPAEYSQASAWIKFSSKDSPELQGFYEDFHNWVQSPIWPNLRVDFYTPEHKQPAQAPGG